MPVEDKPYLQQEGHKAVLWQGFWRPELLRGAADTWVKFVEAVREPALDS